jgi:hypothetical protein
VFEAFSTAVLYDFKSNARTVLGESATAADSFAISLDKLGTAMDAATTASNAFYKSAYKSADSLATLEYSGRAFNRGADLIERGFGKIIKAADTTGYTVDLAMNDIDATVGVTASRVDAASQVMSLGLRDVAASARAAAAGIQSTSVAGNRMQRYAGNVGAAGAGAGAGAAGAAASHGSLTAGDVVGLAALGTLGTGLKNTGDLQQSSAQMGVAMGMSTADTERIFRPIAMQMSMMTAQSTNDTMGELQILATSGFNNPTDLQKDNAAFPMQIARYADTQLLGKHHIATDNSVTTAGTLAHQLGTRTADQLNPMLNTLFKISQDMPDVIDRAATQIRYYGSQYVGAGVSPSEILQLQATADRGGFGKGRSGTGFAQILGALQTPTASQFRAQDDLGLIASSRMVRGKDGKMHRETTDKYINPATGVYDVEGFWQHMNQQYDVARKNGTVGAFNNDLAHLSTVGTRGILQYLSSDAGQAQRRAVTTTLGRVPDLEVAQAQYINNLNGQTQLLTSNFKSLTAVIAQPLQGPLTAIVHGMASGVGGAATFLSSHPLAQDAAAAVVTLGALKGVSSLFKLLGGFSVIAETAAHNARLNVGVHGYMRRGAFHFGGPAAASAAGASGTAAKAAGSGFSAGRTLTGAAGAFDGVTDFVVNGIKGALTLSGLRGAGGALSEFGTAMQTVSRTVSLFGTQALFSSYGVRFVGGALLKLGLAAVSGVGDFMLLYQALNFLKGKIPSIGDALGNAATWITDVGGPKLEGAFGTAWDFALKFFTDGKFFAQTRDAISNAVNAAANLPTDIVVGTAQRTIDRWRVNHGLPEMYGTIPQKADPNATSPTRGGKGGNIPRVMTGGGFGGNPTLTRAEQDHARHVGTILKDHPYAWRTPTDEGPAPASLTGPTTGTYGATTHGTYGATTHGDYGSGTHTPVVPKKTADAGRVYHIAAVYVSGANANLIDDFLDKVEKHSDLDHVGTGTAARHGVRSGTTNGTEGDTMG